MESLGIGFKIFTSTFAGVEVAISAVMCYFFVVAGQDPSGTGASKPCYVKAGQSTPYTGPINSSAIQDYTSWAVMLCNFGAGCAGVQALITLVIMFGLCCNMKMASSCSRSLLESWMCQWPSPQVHSRKRDYAPSSGLN